MSWVLVVAASCRGRRRSEKSWPASASRCLHDTSSAEAPGYAPSRRPGCVHGTVHRLSRRARMSSKHFTLSDRMRECFLETCGLLQDMSFQKAAVAGVRFLWLAMRFCDGFLHMWAGLAPWLMHHPRR